MLDNQEIKRLIIATGLRGENSAAAFEALYRLCAPLLLGVARRLVGRRELAEEVLHDSFTRIWRSAASFNPTSAQPLAWMVTIVRNRAFDVLASHDVSRVDALDAEDYADDGGGLFDWSLDPEQGLEQQRNARHLRDCLATLQAAERQTLTLAYAHGMSHSDLAVHLQKPLGTVKGWIRRGLANLRGCVERKMEGAR
ncbi:MAG: sigma-70 family RNA polymerase sigma factor [Burkholderiales bacterium]|jgi:RNA polymerase sigma-70 factor (ECF subfamily)|nr:sigma-70 family RNA polymerase sigma factor [Burkholderiales bacterium]